MWALLEGLADANGTLRRYLAYARTLGAGKFTRFLSRISSLEVHEFYHGSDVYDKVVMGCESKKLQLGHPENSMFLACLEVKGYFASSFCCCLSLLSPLRQL